jgi:putative NADH-flavin reductase
MKLTIVAATGGIGRQILQQAVAAGHDVTAVVRSPAKITASVRVVRVVRADLSDPDPIALATAVEGADAVLSGLGAHSRADEDVATRGTQAIVTAMKSAGRGGSSW